jgi:hypothetical protein
MKIKIVKILYLQSVFTRFYFVHLLAEVAETLDSIEFAARVSVSTKPLPHRKPIV